MDLPKIKPSRNLKTNKALDEALVSGLDQEGLLRMKAVEEAVNFSMDKSPSVEQFNLIFTNIYQFYKHGNTQVR